MLSDFLRLVLDSVAFLWPLKRVEQYEAGIYLAFGRYWKDVGPGVYLRLPWFVEIHELSVAWVGMNSGRHDITTKDGKMLSFEAAAMVRVKDVKAAILASHDHENVMHTLLSGVLAEKLAEVDPERFGPDKRARLNTDLRKWVEAEAAEIGVEVKWVRFTSFVLNPRTYRLLSEQTGTIG